MKILNFKKKVLSEEKGVKGVLEGHNDISFYDETRVVKRMLATKEIYKVKDGKIEILFKKEGKYISIISVTEDLEEESKFRIDSKMVA